MKLSRVLAPIVAATVILTGCGGPSESDCTKALNKYLQKQEVSIPIPGEVDSSATKDNWVFIIPVPSDDPLAKRDEKMLNLQYKHDYGTDNYKAKYQHELKLAKLFEKAGYMKLKEGVFDKLVKRGSFDDGTLYKVAGYQISFTDKISPYLQSASFIMGPRIKIGNFAVDKITKLDSKPQKFGDYEVYSFAYTQKVENLIEGLPESIIDEIKSDLHFSKHFRERPDQIYKDKSGWKVPR